MKIAHVSFNDVRGVPDRRCDLAPGPGARPHDLILVTGPPASGKTRFLEGILAAFEVVGPYMGIVRAHEWAYESRRSTIELGLWLDEHERLAAPGLSTPAMATAVFGPDGVAAHVDRQLGRLCSRYRHDSETGKREYFPANRQRAWGARLDGVAPMEQSMLRPSRDPHKYAFIPRFLGTLRDDPARGRVFAEKLATLSPTVRYAPEPDEDTAICFRTQPMATVRGAGGGRAGAGSGPLAPIHGLSASEADAVIFAATAVMIGLSHSIVLLDTPELYVPEDRIVAFVQALLVLGLDNQWIVATQSPALLRAVDASALIRIEPRGAS
jgi:hypothetical protein